jgi:hypothetical protein
MATGTCNTVTLAEPAICWPSRWVLAVTCAGPFPSAVASPELETVATASSLDVQSKAAVTVC